MLKVITYNIHGAIGCDRIQDYHRIGELLKSHAIDIALIQEVDTPPAKRSVDQVIADLKTDHFSFSKYAVTVDTPKRWLGNAILSRFPILRSSITEIGGKGRERRNILEATIQTNKGELHVLNTHFGLLRRDRCAQLARLMKALSQSKEIPFIAAGDINEWDPFMPTLRRMNKAFYSPVTTATFPTRFPLFRLDRSWCSSEKILIRTEVLKTDQTRNYSDHYPILMELSL